MPHRSVRNWATEKLEFFFGFYMTWQGVSILATGRTGERSPSFHYLIALSDITMLAPGLILALLFFIPGILTMLPKTRKFGLLVAAMCMLVHAMGTARSVVLSSDGAITAPNTYFFIAFLAGWLYLTERHAR